MFGLDICLSPGYRVIRLWEQDSAPFLANPGLLPLATLTQTDSPQGLLAQVAERAATIPDRGQRQNIAGCAEILAGFLITRQLTQQLGEVDSSLIEQIRRLSIEQLEALGITLLDFSEVADLVAWLEQQEVSD